MFHVSIYVQEPTPVAKWSKLAIFTVTLVLPLNNLLFTIQPRYGTESDNTLVSPPNNLLLTIQP